MIFFDQNHLEDHHQKNAFKMVLSCSGESWRAGGNPLTGHLVSTAALGRKSDHQRATKRGALHSKCNPKNWADNTYGRTASVQ